MKNKELDMVKLGLVSLVASSLLFVGCSATRVSSTASKLSQQKKYTLDDLIEMARQDPLQKPAFEAPGKEEIAIDPLDEKYLIGKWFSKMTRYLKVWWTDGNALEKKSLRAKTENTFEFKSDGTFHLHQRFTAMGGNDWKEVDSAGRWNYSAENGDIVLVYDNGQTDDVGFEARVFWWAENQISIRGRGNGFDTEGALDATKDGTAKKRKMDMHRDKFGWTHSQNSTVGENDISHVEILFTPETYTRISTPPIIAKTSYKMISCSKEQGSDFAYKFVIELEGSPSNPIQAFRSIQKDFRKALLNDYADSYAGANRSDLRVGFPEYDWKDGHIKGRAVILAIQPVRMKYDSTTRTGLMAVRFGVGQYKDAREWIRQNIETLARDKNIALTTGEIPPAAKFYLGREELKDGNVLEIEFKTE